MRSIILILLLSLVVTISFGQSKTKGKVKRKYQKTEQVSKELPRVFVRGAVYDEDYIPLPGATVTVDGTPKGVNTNADGEYFIDNLVEGRARIRVSFIGYKTRTVDIILVRGQNTKNVMLLMNDAHVEPILVSAQHRNQQIMGIPAAVSSVSDSMLRKQNILDLCQLSDFVAGVNIYEQGAINPTYTIRGISSKPNSPGAQSRIAVFSNNVPINRISTSALELFDMERVEILKGPQNTLFGRGAQAGAIHYISKKPINKFIGSITAGLGDYTSKETRAMINVPVIKDKLFVRAAGIYNQCDGYIENTFGGDLMGNETVAGRFSARFKPQWNHSLDLVVNYQKDDTPGIAFMSDTFPNTNGVSDIFSGVASHEKGDSLGTGKEIIDATLNYKFYINEHTYWTSISSYRKTDGWSRWDGDGTASEALDMSEYENVEQFYQEIRGNFSQNGRMNGSLGASFMKEKADQTNVFSSNEQHLAGLMLFSDKAPVLSNGEPHSLSSILSQNGNAQEFPTFHEESSISNYNNTSIQGFFDMSYQLTRKLFFSGGARAVYDRYKLTYAAIQSDGDASVLGEQTDNSPNVFYAPVDSTSAKKSSLSFTYHGGLKYRFNEYGNVFVNYSRGRRPNVLQYATNGDEEEINPEIINSFDLGFKASFFDRIYIEANGFYQYYKNFQTDAWRESIVTGELSLQTNENGKATLYGAEANLRIAVVEGIDLLASYAWLETAFDSTNTSDQTQIYADNTFSLAPKHSFAVGLNIKANITPTIQFFLNPSVSYKTNFYFDHANTPEFEQEAYTLLNANGGLEFKDPNIILTVWASNILDEQYVTGIGQTGLLYGLNTYVPGPPKMIGTKLTWNFTKKKKKIYQKKRRKNPWS